MNALVTLDELDAPPMGNPNHFCKASFPCQDKIYRDKPDSRSEPPAGSWIAWIRPWLPLPVALFTRSGGASQKSGEAAFPHPGGAATPDPKTTSATLA